MKKVNKKLYKRIIIALILIYFVFTLISQQKTINTYRSAEKDYQTQLTEAKETNKTLQATKANASSMDYIEKTAREKLDMYLPNERVYVDAEK